MTEHKNGDAGGNGDAGAVENSVARAVLEVLNDPAVREVIQQVIARGVLNAPTESGAQYWIDKEEEGGEQEKVGVDWFYKMYSDSYDLYDMLNGRLENLHKLHNMSNELAAKLYNMLDGGLVELHNMLNEHLVELHNMLNERLIDLIRSTKGQKPATGGHYKYGR